MPKRSLPPARRSLPPSAVGKSYKVKDRLDVLAPRQALTTLAAELGFNRRAQAELAIVISELASNIVKYGVRGSLELAPIEDATHGLGVAIVAHDVGPAFHDLGMALQDGCDDHGPIDPKDLLKRDGLGIGLGAVVRLTHGFNVEYQAQGKAIRVVRYLRAPRTRRTIVPL
jgi:anti-sigma regulatory factor (Ser/Thr protein kinase)